MILVSGEIDCEATENVDYEFQAALSNLFDDIITDRQIYNPVMIDCSVADNNTFHEISKQISAYGIKNIIVSPVRSESGASGAILAFYRDNDWVPSEAINIISAISDQAAATISYTMAIEQLRYMLDDMAGANQELSTQATIDSLTGLPNHRSLQQNLIELCRASKRNKNRVFSIVMVDVDHFKIYNDSHGHLEGRAVFKTRG